MTSPSPLALATPDAILLATVLLVAAMSGLLALRLWVRWQRRRSGEAAEQAAQARLRSILGAVPDLMFELDAQRRFLDVWASDPALLLLPRERLLGRRISEVMPPDAANAALRAMDLAAKEGRSLGERLSLDLAGGRRHFELSVSRIDDGVDCSQGQHRFVVLSRDVTESVQLELDLRTITECAGDGIWTADRQGRYLYANAAALQLTGHKLDELKQMSIVDLLDPIDRPRLQAHVEALEAGQVMRGEWHLLRKDGGQVLVELTTQALPDGRRMAIGRDISEQLQTRDALRRAARVFAASSEGIIVTDVQMRIVDVNPAFSAITGYTREEVLGRSPSELSSGRQDADFYARLDQTLAEQGFWRGEVWNRRKSGEIYPEDLAINAVRDEHGKLVEYLGTFSDISAIKQHETELHRIAYYDVLTGLPNRRLLADRLSQTMARATRDELLCAVCYIDLDGFKPVNDQFGHATGDLLLLQIAHRLSLALRAGDTLARIGGDEFVLVLDELQRQEDCEPALQRTLEAIAQPLTLNGHTVQISASIGVTLFPLDARDGDTLLRHADQAMYRAKELGKNRYQIFDAELDRQRAELRHAFDAVQQGFERGEFELFYQPKIDLQTGAVAGCEALLRWRRADGSLVPPLEFLPLLQGQALELRVSEWVLAQAARQIEIWKRARLPHAISVNLTARHLECSEFADWLQALVERHPDMRASDLQLEVLESSALDSVERTARTLSRLRELGIGLALDDFGTGYSSLAYFRKLPVDMLKIDQGFVRDMLVDPEDLGIVDNVVRLAAAFNRQVIAEGVETLEHWRYLLALGCHHGQGYGIARPMPAADFPSWYQRWTAERSWEDACQHPLQKYEIELGVASASLRRWMERVRRALGNGLREELKAAAQDGVLSAWLQGNGRSQFGRQAGFGHLLQLQLRLQAAIEQMIAAVEASRPDLALQRLPEMEAVQQQALQALSGLGVFDEPLRPTGTA